MAPIIHEREINRIFQFGLLLHNFEFLDSQITLNDLIENSIDLVNYREGRFEWIYKNHVEITTKYDI